MRESNGGLLKTGNPGNAGGSGRPPSMIREQLRGSFADRIAFLDSVVDGDVMQTMQITFGAAVSLLKCPHCDHAGLELLTKDSETLSRTVTVKVSASTSDRLKAADILAKYGLGTSNESNVNLNDKRVLTREEREERTLTLIKPAKVG